MDNSSFCICPDRRIRLSALHNIRRLVKIDTIPVLGTGKIDYRQLKTALA